MAEEDDVAEGDEPSAPSSDRNAADGATAAAQGGSRADTAASASFLAAALEGSSNSSRLDAKLAVSGAPEGAGLCVLSLWAPQQ